ncbi:ESCRT-II complex subunit VPS36 [Strigomonas culicis]|uniref:Vacuolar protein-sorting-associated protein 36 n=1 Tax=Strigomonas culicis TaxID=28005 RepID=S9UCL3_9TRYP|nr:ESCRT-II complex subunit VPS36 [Strigomonas culicis]|eukprot:EPY28547.1 ESCRT-II complex subunit VPS36 [Strigomonas culicis]
MYNTYTLLLYISIALLAFTRACIRMCVCLCIKNKDRKKKNISCFMIFAQLQMCFMVRIDMVCRCVDSMLLSPPLIIFLDLYTRCPPIQCEPYILKKEKKETMEYWKWATGSVVQGDEVLIVTQAGAGLYDRDKKTDWKDGHVSVTTHSIVFQAGDPENTVLKLSLEDLSRSGHAPVKAKGSLFSSDKIVLHLPSNQYAKIAFRKSGMDTFYDKLMDALGKKAWQTRAPTSTTPSASTIAAAAPAASAVASRAEASPAARGSVARKLKEDEERVVETHMTADRIGIAGVMQYSAESVKVQGTLKDIEDVMQQASALVANIKRMKLNAAGASGANEADASALESIEETLGLGVMVKGRASGGKDAGTKQQQYHRELGRELHAWMTHPRNAKLFGELPLVPLIELFSLYNKARSGDLVSPDDVLLACRELEQQPGAVYHLETLRSGRLALVHNDRSIILARLTALLGPQLAAPGSERLTSTAAVRQVPTTHTLPASPSALKSVTDVQLAGLLQVDAAVALDLLEGLEEEGYLCRSDAGFGCATFYWNIFVFASATG